MSYNTYTTDDLVEDIKTLGHFPVANNTFTTTKLLRLATLEIQTPLVKQIMSTRGGYYLTTEDFSSAAILSSGTVPIPSSCVAGAIHLVRLVSGDALIPVNPISEGELLSSISPASSGYGYYFEGNSLQILPSPLQGNVRLTYLKRTSDLVATTAAAQVTAVDHTTYTVTVATLPSTMVVDTTVDSCGDQPPFNLLGSTRTITAVNGLDVTLDADVEDLAVGDWLALEGQTPIPQIPVEFRLLLAWRVVELAWELQGSREKAEFAKKRRMEYINDTMGLISTRVNNDSKIIMPVNGGFASGVRSRFKYPATRNS